MRDELRVEERPAYEILCEAYIEISGEDGKRWTSGLLLLIVGKKAYSHVKIECCCCLSIQGFD